jgi:hypothetical protein
MRRALLLPLLGVILLGQGCLDDPPQKNRPIIFDFFQKNKPAESAYTSPVSTTGTRIEPIPLKPGEVGSDSQALAVSSVVPHQLLPNPFVLLGRAVAMERTVYWRVRNSRGDEIATGSVLTDAQDDRSYGAFRARAFYNKPSEVADGTVEVFTHAPGGWEQSVVRIPVLLEREVTPVKLFFINEQDDPELAHCDKPQPVTRRVAKTTQVAEITMLELLNGPTAAEQQRGYRTAILPGTQMRALTIERDVATVDLSRQFTLGLREACNAQAAPAQMTSALKQLPDITTVQILIEGTALTSSQP